MSKFAFVIADEKLRTVNLFIKSIRYNPAWPAPAVRFPEICFEFFSSDLLHFSEMCRRADARSGYNRPEDKLAIPVRREDKDSTFDHHHRLKP